MRLSDVADWHKADMDPTSLDVRYWGQSGNPQPRHHGCVRLTDKHLAQWCIALMNEIIGWSGACATYSKQMASPYIRRS